MLAATNTFPSNFKLLLSFILLVACNTFSLGSNFSCKPLEAGLIEAPVTDLKASKGEYTTCVRLEWTRIKKAIAYRIYRKRLDCKDCDFGDPIQRVFNNYWNDSDAKAGKKYLYYVTAELESPATPHNFNPNDISTWGLKKERVVALSTPVLNPVHLDQSSNIHLSWTPVPEAEWYSVYIFEADQRIEHLQLDEEVLVNKDSITHLAYYARVETAAYKWSLVPDKERFYYVMLRAENDEAISTFTPLTPIIVQKQSFHHVEDISRKDPFSVSPGSFFSEHLPLATHISRAYHIPVPILLAAAGLETRYGQTELATQANNFFALKADNQWEGPVFVMGTLEARKDPFALHRFRQYNSPESSFRDFAQHLRNDPKYYSLFQHSCENYRAWAEGLENHGFNKDSEYAEKLIRIIHHYQLYRHCTLPASRNRQPSERISVPDFPGFEP